MTDTTSTPGKLWGVGLGPGDPELVTVKAARVIAAADVIAFHSARHGRSISRGIAAPYMRADQLEEHLVYPVTTETTDHPGGYQGAIDEFYEQAAQRLSTHLAAGRSVALLAAGDPLFYSSYMHMHRRLADRFETEIIPGITSVSAASAALGTPLVEGEQVLTVLPGTMPVDELTRRLRDTEAAAIMKLGRTYPGVRQALSDSGRLDDAYYVERASSTRQRVLRAADVADADVPYFAITVVPGPSPTTIPTLSANSTAVQQVSGSSRNRSADPGHMENSSPTTPSDGPEPKPVAAQLEEQDTAQKVLAARVTHPASSDREQYPLAGATTEPALDTTGAADSDHVTVVRHEPSAKTSAADEPAIGTAGAIGGGHLTVVGLGPGAAAWTTSEVLEALSDATDLVGYTTYLNRVPVRPGQRRHASDNRVESERAAMALDLARRGARVVVVSSGDPGVFAMAAAVLEEAGDPQWAGVPVRVLPGLTAANAVASRVGAPLGHDYAMISLSDRLKPWEVVAQRLSAVAAADMAIAVYNPASSQRTWQVGAMRELLLEHRKPDTPVVLGRDVGGPAESVRVVALGELDPADVDMRTLLIIGASTTVATETDHGVRVYTSRRYAGAGDARSSNA
ncbi:precorrin-2 C(20)-methyltransferase [Nocardia brasiliensis]|uniref:Bifunctional precorrin-2 C20-methyltransferase/precorrin-3 methylase n=1 Tax=Nocardia brasiliensis (strain ATCC 700358 / HUJEG-1) TaxID=1133849 RepID=K0F1L8_NOCB7|nr:precorrin-2 C(20)-methyltransferase [Nocardia brasiliensis]AFU03284.1 bifunctional precorrin-2 C20-methyltransferase/precorrin-3 methylase [Nocardia brasiliensis ATCC 700358]OCF86856.1 precorrin-2 C20-methyltransferase [Nocardia brasiliensis]